MADLGRGPTMPPFIPLVSLRQKLRDKNTGFSKVPSTFWNVVTRGTSPPPPQKKGIYDADLEISVRRCVVSKLGAVELLVI